MLTTKLCLLGAFAIARILAGFLPPQLVGVRYIARNSVTYAPYGMRLTAFCMPIGILGSVN
jgi:hypothetical protein